MSNDNQDPKPEVHPLSGAFDVLAVFSLAVLPDLLHSFMATNFISTNSSDAGSSSINSFLILLIVRSLQVSLPILLVLKLRNVRWSDYGFVKFRPLLDPLVAIGIAVLGYVTYYLYAYGLLFAGVDFSGDANAIGGMTQNAQLGIGTIALVVLSSCANGFAEEIAMRSYLLVRIGELCGSIVVAAVLTTILFAAYHSYQGRYGIVSALAIGAVFATYFVVTKRFWPVAIAHALMDIVGLAALLTQSAG